MLSLLPLWALYILSDLFYVLLYYLARYRRKVVEDNLRKAFPEKNNAELKRIRKQFYRYLADFIVETIKAITISEQELKRRVTLTNPELIRDYYRAGRKVITVGAHYCNWELAGLNFYFHTDKKFMIVYKPLSDQTFDNFFFRIRSRFGTIPVAMRQTLRRVVELKDELWNMALLGDQTPGKDDAIHFVDFLNRKTAVFMGVEKLAKAVNAVVIYYEMKRTKRGYYSYTLIPLCEEPRQTAEYEITEKHVKHLENIIKEDPQYWLWSHRRWKFTPEDSN